MEATFRSLQVPKTRSDDYPHGYYPGVLIESCRNTKLNNILCSASLYAMALLHILPLNPSNGQDRDYSSSPAVIEPLDRNGSIKGP